MRRERRALGRASRRRPGLARPAQARRLPGRPHPRFLGRLGRRRRSIRRAVAPALSAAHVLGRKPGRTVRAGGGGDVRNPAEQGLSAKCPPRELPPHQGQGPQLPRSTAGRRARATLDEPTRPRRARGYARLAETMPRSGKPRGREGRREGDGSSPAGRPPRAREGTRLPPRERGRRAGAERFGRREFRPRHARLRSPDAFQSSLGKPQTARNERNAVQTREIPPRKAARRARPEPSSPPFAAAVRPGARGGGPQVARGGAALAFPGGTTSARSRRADGEGRRALPPSLRARTASNANWYRTWHLADEKGCAAIDERGKARGA